MLPKMCLCCAQSVEERRTYRDHTGKEEVTVTQLDPSAAGSLLSSQG